MVLHGALIMVADVAPSLSELLFFIGIGLVPGVFINNPMITITIRISSPGLIFNPTIIDYRLDHAAITDYD